MDEPYTRELAPGVFAYVQPDGSWFLNNTGIIVAPEVEGGVVMVDHVATERRGRALMGTVERLGAGRALTTLINTHHHGDHTFGNYLVPAGTSVVGHELCRAEVIATGTSVTTLFEGPDWGDIRLRPPEITFREQLTVWAGTLRLELVHFGGPAHTTNDVVVHVPDHGVVFCGDLVFAGGTPLAVQGSIRGWLTALDRLAELGARTLVPGHGPVCGPEEISQVRGYLEFVRDTAAAGWRRGQSPLELAENTDLGQFGGLTDPERIVANLHRAYAELDDPHNLGKTLDLAPAMLDMRRYLGGPLVSYA
ncbi:MBL fold metallo-hydrolase [Lipingzhangella sp. LS1_29]|uniref:MBL fold metallo-hydrolase n=1 Tax=Lipingzhangella rawalii TaxID=2055835 RepID=A0ABU2H1S1_9ACTN|nr:MBL fold metallo-hydrolase [Lipingzhangella rawalii]MDS1268952.1 MBL fold metallo-hydrolase [Lipingzhangella rawalii]